MDTPDPETSDSVLEVQLPYPFLVRTVLFHPRVQER